MISKNRKCPQCFGLGLVAALVVAVSAPTVQAKQAEPATPTPAVAASTPAASASAPTPAPPPPPYSLPWQLRPVVAANVVRSDTAVSFYENGTENASTVASTLLLSYKVLPKLAPMVRLAYVHNSPGAAPGSGNAVVNPLVGATYQLDLAPGLRMGLFLGVTVPIGQGGDKPAGMDSTAAAAGAGINARSAMDNALFAVNFMTVIPGFGLAYIQGGLHGADRGDVPAADPRAQLGHRARFVPHQLHQRPAHGLLRDPAAVIRRRGAVPALAV